MICQLNIVEKDLCLYKLDNYIYPSVTISKNDINIINHHFQLEKYKQNFNFQQEFITEIKKLKKDIKTYFIENDYVIVVINEILWNLKKNIYDSGGVKYFIISNYDNYDRLILYFNNSAYSTTNIYSHLDIHNKILRWNGLEFQIHIDDSLDFILYGRYHTDPVLFDQLIYAENYSKCGIFKMGDDKNIAENYNILYPYSKKQYIRNLRNEKLKRIND